MRSEYHPIYSTAHRQSQMKMPKTAQSIPIYIDIICNCYVTNVGIERHETPTILWANTCPLKSFKENPLSRVWVNCIWPLHEEKVDIIKDCKCIHRKLATPVKKCRQSSQVLRVLLIGVEVSVLCSLPHLQALLLKYHLNQRPPSIHLSLFPETENYHLGSAFTS